MPYRLSTLAVLIAFNVFVLSALLAPGTAFARAPEPATIDPVKDAAYLATLGLASQDWSDQIINILIVGQDGQTTYHKDMRHVRPSGEKIEDLSSHADGNMLLSFNKKTGTVSILSLYRGYLVHDDKWVGVDDTPAAVPEGQFSNRYLANYYLYAGRAKYVAYAREALDSFIRSRRLEKTYLMNDTLKIHGLVETNFDGFKSAMNQFIDYFGSSAKIAWAMKGHSSQLFTMLTDRTKIMAELRSQPAFQVMTEKRKAELAEDPARAMLGTLRERVKYEGGGYQRSFNHAKFVSYILGLIGYTMAEADFADFLKEPAISKAFGTFSRSFELSTFDKNLRMKDRGLHMIARTGFQNGESQMYLIQIGTSIASYSIYQDGQFAVLDGTGFISKIDPKIQIIPKPNDCPACRPR